jgi:hypothetical protein
MFGDRWSMKVVSLTTGDMALASRPGDRGLHT